MNWIHKYAVFMPDEEQEYLEEIADLLDGKTFVKNADPEKGLHLLMYSLYDHAWGGERQNWSELEQAEKDVFIIQQGCYIEKLEYGEKAERPERPAWLEAGGKTAEVKTLRAVANDMQQIFGSINSEWLAQLMSAATGNPYSRDRIRKRIADMK